MENTTEVKPRTLRLWLDELSPELHAKVMTYNKAQGYEHRLNMKFTSGIAALSMAFDNMFSNEGSLYWAEVACRTY